MAHFLIAPQWQGSPSARAMLLTDGAAAIAGDLPRAATTVLDVPLEAGESLATGVHRLSSLQRIRSLIGEQDVEGSIVIGGDCGVSVWAIDALPGDRSDLAVVWCDAHPDLHTPDSSPSGAFSGMALRALLGDGEPSVVLSPGIPAHRVVVVGARSVDPAEEASLEELHTLSPNDLSAENALADAVATTGATRVWVHIDVDVIDPSQISGVSDAAPFGVDAGQLARSIRALRERVPLAGATIAGFAPRSPTDAVDDLGVLLRLIGALA